MERVSTCLLNLRPLIIRSFKPSSALIAAMRKPLIHTQSLSKIQISYFNETQLLTLFKRIYKLFTFVKCLRYMGIVPRIFLHRINRQEPLYSLGFGIRIFACLLDLTIVFDKSLLSYYRK